MQLKSQVIDWGHSIFFIQSETTKIIVALSPSRLKISDYLPYSIMFYVR